jgi:hypothetical protein
MSVHSTTQEEVMGKAIPAQHPAVVLRSHYRHLRTLLAVALIAIVGLSTAVVILATDDDQHSISASTATSVSAPGPDGIRYDGGPEEGTAALTQRSAPAAFDPNSIKQAPGVRYDGGPEEGSRGVLTSGAPGDAVAGVRYDGGPEEGTTGPGR